MTARWADFQIRKDKILSITIEEYIRTILPVSSQFISEKYPLDLSSATIRNILAELEEEGFLTHPHTSAGRIPTQKGYRYYVDHLMDEIQLLEEEKGRIKSEYELKKVELETLLDKTSRVIAETTHYTSIISVDGWENKIFCRGTAFIVEYPDHQDIHKIGSILKMLDQKEQLLEVINQKLVKKVEILIGQEMHCSGVNSCSLAISSYKARDGISGRMAVLGPTRMNYEKVVSTLDYFSKLISEIE